MKIAVVGTGALGSLYAGYLAGSGEEVYAIDIKEDIISAIRSSGIRIVEPKGNEFGRRKGCRRIWISPKSMRSYPITGVKRGL